MDLEHTPLAALHVELGAKMVPFAGYSMPVQYPMGVMQEHNHTRTHAGLFDVSHMGQVRISGPSWEDVALGFERLVPMDVLGLADGRQRYGLFTNDAGGIEDDLMFARQGDNLFVVVNAACKHADLERMQAALVPELTVTALTDRALIALQGPQAVEVVARLDPRAANMRFMDCRDLDLGGIPVWASRSGYTGEDGFELSVAADQAEALARSLLAQDEVAPIGLGARDSLRLEAGLCLYGHDMDAATTPVEASLSWSIQKLRRKDGARAGGFPGDDVLLHVLGKAPLRRRVGLRPDGRAPMREGVEIFEHEDSETPVGKITSGGFGPTVGGPVAMGYVPETLSAAGQALWAEVRGKRLPLKVAALPFVPANFKR
jgi:aminomethyltransferase